MTRSAGSPSWRTCAFGDADAWFVNGQNVRVMPSGTLKVAPGLPTERALNLNLSEVDRPVAFALPLASGDIEPRCTFDPASKAATHGVLAQFEGWLRLLRVQFVLGAQLVAREAELRRGVYHVSYSGSLLAVLDLYEGKCAISPGAHPADLWEAQWDKRPVGAGATPPGFLAATPAQLAWAYVCRTDRDLLPARYVTDLIYYRHVPRVPVRWLRDSQLMLVRELSVEPATFEALRQRTGLTVRHLKQDLTCLYYATAITITRSKAAKLSVAREDSQPVSTEPGLHSLLSNEGNWEHGGDMTAPALLERRSDQPKSKVT
ncbi:hypothetical protein [Caenimonas soli]|uniref:hypothetical protein n=1 Tax=Caenimonas soli TaxID=2735555 RepID=UPI001553C2F4|nr:hypothetical protein [Caenimonas soli]NPC57670.1 hypothetical protein [Caenimonas soli]